MKRFREVFLYSDEDEIQNESLPEDTNVSRGLLNNEVAVGICVSDIPSSISKEEENSDSREQKESNNSILDSTEANEGASHIKSSETSDAEWVVDTEGVVNKKHCSAPHETGLMRVQIVEADNGFQDTEVSFQASMEEQQKNNYHYRMWLEQEDFVCKTLGHRNGREIESSITNGASEPSSWCFPEDNTRMNCDENHEKEENENFENPLPIHLMNSCRMKPIIDGVTGKVHEVETVGGYCLTVDESEFMDSEAETEERRNKSGSKGVCDIGEEESEEDDDDNDEELEERRMDALVTVAVAKRLVDCFQDKEMFEELEAPLKVAGQSFLEAVLPLFQQREQHLFLSRQATNVKRKEVHKRDSLSETYSNNAVTENELCSRSCLASSENPHTVTNCFKDTTFSAPSTNHSFLTMKEEVLAHEQEDKKIESNKRITLSPDIYRNTSCRSSPTEEDEREKPLKAEITSSEEKRSNRLADPFPIDENDSFNNIHNESQLLLGLENDEVFAKAVDPHLRKVLRLYRRSKQPPKVENVVIDGVMMDF